MFVDGLGGVILPVANEAVRIQAQAIAQDLFKGLLALAPQVGPGRAGWQQGKVSVSNYQHTEAIGGQSIICDQVQRDESAISTGLSSPEFLHLGELAHPLGPNVPARRGQA